MWAKKFAYDIWGDTVNLASRMESHGEAGKLNISGVTYAQVMDYLTYPARPDQSERERRVAHVLRGTPEARIQRGCCGDHTERSAVGGCWPGCAVILRSALRFQHTDHRDPSEVGEHQPIR
ncbi:MAG: hypothetical protein IPH63_10540 [Flavobacteriales bacterium]|nr:hypothetical protein [Flavobacteriales bacterium]